MQLMLCQEFCESPGCFALHCKNYKIQYRYEIQLICVEMLREQDEVKKFQSREQLKSYCIVDVIFLKND